MNVFWVSLKEGIIRKQTVRNGGDLYGLDTNWVPHVPSLVASPQTESSSDEEPTLQEAVSKKRHSLCYLDKKSSSVMKASAKS